MGNKPMKKFRVSNWEGVVWENKKTIEGGEIEYKTVTVSRSYRKKDENVWRSEVINNIRLNDIAKLSAILSKLQDFLYFDAKEHDKEEVNHDE